jgi:hypothetical protein
LLLRLTERVKLTYLEPQKLEWRKEMLATEDRIHIMSALGRENSYSTRINVLKELWLSPPDAPELIDFIKPWCSDETLCVYSLPYMFAEVGWLAANALCAISSVTSKKVQKDHKVEICELTKPLSTDEIVEIANSINLPVAGGLEGISDAWRILHKAGKLPQINFVIHPSKVVRSFPDLEIAAH